MGLKLKGGVQQLVGGEDGVVVGAIWAPLGGAPGRIEEEVAAGEERRLSRERCADALVSRFWKAEGRAVLRGWHRKLG